MPNDKHNNPDLISMDDLRRAAQAANITVEEAALNIADALGMRCTKGAEATEATERNSAESS